MGKLPSTAAHRASLWLNQGISPRRLALTLALGIGVGCIPVVGVPTLLCAALAFAFRLNFPAIQAANYAVMPLQLLLIVPFVRLGQRLLPSAPGIARSAFLHLPSLHLAASVSGLAGQALLAWLLVAVPSVLLLTIALTRLLERIPALNPSQK
jgi:uncharacterized protein (DUF2062 family)